MAVFLPGKGAWVAELGICRLRPRLARVRSVTRKTGGGGPFDLELVICGTDGAPVHPAPEGEPASRAVSEVCSGSDWCEIAPPDFVAVEATERYGPLLEPVFRVSQQKDQSLYCPRKMKLMSLLRVQYRPRPGDRLIKDSTGFILEVTGVEKGIVSWQVLASDGAKIASEHWTVGGWARCVAVGARLPDDWQPPVA